MTIHRDVARQVLLCEGPRPGVVLLTVGTPLVADSGSHDGRRR
ncbi:hypothetical protein OJF2_07130 [Aquisphaera giovannonii]|uniref:Uncharacterized protein n=1 Tax=Aquisphaera giovannonii TaxID=406548 RepID=A0A5B9VVZ8_9BACT|nr:hypothetical protein [Aquisphaera giovannonii]QEH32244.1 hypothetical protein OJF2_07130 [Aquisphaera giovannonii]